MYLDVLSEKERKIFLDLAYQAMECDGQIAPEEVEVIKSYEKECGLPDYKRTQRTLEENLKLLRESEMTNRRIVLLELCGIWAADNVWKNEELAMMDKVAAGLGILSDKASRIRRWSKEFRELISEGFSILSED